MNNLYEYRVDAASNGATQKRHHLTTQKRISNRLMLVLIHKRRIIKP